MAIAHPAAFTMKPVAGPCVLSLQIVMVGPIGDEYGESAKHLLEKGGPGWCRLCWWCCGCGWGCCCGWGRGCGWGWSIASACNGRVIDWV